MLNRKIMNCSFIFIFMIILLLPSFFLNTKKEQVSEIDNRKLTELVPFQGFSWDSLNNLRNNIESYYTDRLGFRTQMITLNQIYNDKLFGLLVHPSYEYGKDSYIYFKFGREWTRYSEFIDKYTDYIKKMQTYCEERNVDFLFAPNPSKTILYSEYLPDGVNYRFGLYNDLLSRLSDKKIRYLDLAEPLFKTKNELNIPVCNVKYDAGHWNMHGAFYAMSSVMEKLSEKSSVLSPLNPDDFNLTYQTAYTLPVARFPIEEEVPHYTPKKVTNVIVNNDFTEEIRKGTAFPYFTHYVNAENPSGPKIFVFHGSHLGNEVQQYIIDQFSEAVFIYSYNIISDFPYYFNIFEPDIVLYEVADRTILSTYVNIASFENKVLQPEYAKFMKLPEKNLFSLEKMYDSINNDTENIKRLRELSFNIEGEQLKYAYLKIGNNVYDFDIDNNGEVYKISIIIDKAVIEDISEAVIILIPSDSGSKQSINIYLN